MLHVISILLLAASTGSRSVAQTFFFKQQLGLLQPGSQITPLSHMFNATEFSIRSSHCTAPLLPFSCQQCLFPCCLHSCIPLLLPVSGNNCSLAKAQGHPFTLTTPTSMYCSHKQSRVVSVELQSLVTEITGKTKCSVLLCLRFSLDFRKAFYIISHSLFMGKLAKFGRKKIYRLTRQTRHD